MTAVQVTVFRIVAVDEALDLFFCFWTCVKNDMIQDEISKMRKCRQNRINVGEFEDNFSALDFHYLQPKEKTLIKHDNHVKRILNMIYLIDFT